MSRTPFVRLAVLPLALAGALALAACGSSSGAPADQPATTVAMKDGDKMTETTVAMADGDKMTETTAAMKDGDKMVEPSTTAKP